MQLPVEETKDLIALHNLSSTNLSKALELGGFPMPSIAVTRTNIPHTNFGDITLVMNKSTIDPQSDKRNTVYSADAWTPTFPGVEYEADEAVKSRLLKKFTELRNKYGRENVDALYSYANLLSDELTRYGGIAGIIELNDTPILEYRSWQKTRIFSTRCSTRSTARPTSSRAEPSNWRTQSLAAV